MLGPEWIVLVVVVVVADRQRDAQRARAAGARARHRHHRQRRRRAGGMDFGALHRVLLAGRGALRRRRRCSSILVGLHARRRRPAADVPAARRRPRTRSTPCRSATSTSQARGDLLSRVTNDIDNVAQSLQQTLSQMLTSVLLLIGVAVMMFTISPLLALVALTTVPVSVCGDAERSRSGPGPASSRSGGAPALLNAQIEETFTGHAIVKAFGRQREVEAALPRRPTTSSTSRRSARSSCRASCSRSRCSWATSSTCSSRWSAACGWRAARSPIGDIQAFIQYSRNFSMPLTQLASMMNVFQSGIASFERVHRVPRRRGADRPTPVDGAIRRAGAGPGRVPRRARSPTTPTGRSSSRCRWWPSPARPIAIVGPTGAGKTTLVNLIMRFYELDGGAITLDGRDISSIPRRELRSKIGMVLQDTWLFGGTIRDNIAYGNPDATEEQILEAAEATYVDRFVHSLPDGYDTRDQRGGRQHQRRAEAAAHDRPRVPRRPRDPHPRRGDQLGRHPHRGADPGGDERAAARTAPAS